MGKAALALLFITLPAACFGDEPQERKVRIFETVDVFWTGNADNALQSDSADAARELVNQGFDAAEATVQKQSAIGARVGVLIPVARVEGLDMGASVGYISGPNSKTILNARSAIFGQGFLVDDRRIQFLRGLAEAHYNLPLAGNWSMDLGAGAGAAMGFVRDSCSANGLLLNDCAFNYVTTSWTGFSWEASPSIVYKVNSTLLDFGMRYAGFPKFGGTNNTSRIVWRPLGIFLGAAFRFD